MPEPPNFVKTRFLILSDTHGIEFQPNENPPQHFDVAVHCGDLTEESKLDEFRATIRLLKGIDASLKLVIAGNHDFTLDVPNFRQKVKDITPPVDLEQVKSTYGDEGEVRQILAEAELAGITFLDEGIYEFTLDNHAKLTVYASPWTPSLGDWGFQYHPNEGHKFQIPKGVDLAITHGPPKGIMDYTASRQRAGCPDLFRAIHNARPRIHCFGHIHESWGAKLITWRKDPTATPSHFTDIDNARSAVIENLSSFKHTQFDDEESKSQKSQKEQQYRSERVCFTSHTAEDARNLEYEKQTLFVNAAIQGTEECPLQLPWLVDIDLPTS